MKKTPLNKVSAKQEIENQKKELFKNQFYLEQEGICKKCGRYMSYRIRTLPNYPELVHKKPLSAGGKTNRKNCVVECAEHHANERHHLRNKYNESPSWRK